MTDKVKKPVMVFLSKDEKSMVQKRAKNLGLNSMSAYIRYLIHQDKRAEERRDAVA